RDNLAGGGGNDRLEGGKGNDVLNGNGGRDTFVFSARDGSDLIRGFRNGQDEISIKSGAANFDQLNISDRGGDAIIQFRGTTIRLDNVDSSVLDESDFNFGRRAGTKSNPFDDPEDDGLGWMIGGGADDLL
ncbi:MAG: hypothetical protein AAFU55_04075, partial [Pseudomonadota bacterium]